VSNEEKIPYSILDLASVKEGGTFSETFRNSVDLARHAEEWGYTRFWMAEHHNMAGIASAATSVLIGHVAGATKSIRVGSGGVMLPNHPSMVIAEQFGTLEALYPGRIDLGVGRAPGSDQLTARALGRDMHAADHFPEQVRELLDFLGPRAYQAKVTAIPGVDSNVPVWLLGSSTFSAQLAALIGLPFAFAAHFAPRMLHEALRLYRENFQPSKWMEKPYAMVGIPVVAAESDAEAQFLATSMYQRILRLHRGHPILIPPPIESMDGKWNEFERHGVESHLGAAIIGGPETVREKLARFVTATGCDEIMIATDVYDHEKRVRSYEIVSQQMPVLVA
jgi:luciferase family oxidoreductase group 1